VLTATVTAIRASRSNFAVACKSHTFLSDGRMASAMELQVEAA
jgi:hypothetical protein